MKKNKAVRREDLTVRHKLGQCLYGGKYPKVRRLGEKLYVRVCVCVRTRFYIPIYLNICYSVKLFYKLYYVCIYKCTKNKYKKHTKTHIHVHTRIYRISPNRLTSAIIRTFFRLFIRRDSTKRYRLGHALGEGQKLGLLIYSLRPNRQFFDLITGQGMKKNA